MSMNLYLRVGNNHVDLQQTPTQITYMCLANESGGFETELTGQAARRALSCYLLWREYESYKYKMDQDDKKYYNEHTNEIKDIIKSKKRITVYVM